eukprot:gene43415-58811_t
MRCDGGNLPHVQYQLDDPGEYTDEHIFVVGGGDAGIENAMGLIADAGQNNTVTLLNRGADFPTAKKPNVDGLLAARMEIISDCRSAAISATTKRARDQLTLTQTDIVTAVQAVQKVDGALANIS